MRRFALLLIAARLGAQAAPVTDWPSLAKYRQANADLGAPKADEKRVVFMGNSITEGWAPLFPTQFAGKPYVGRGISGQTTPQMLIRFRQDVVALRPAVVVILAGTNDIAGNTGPSTLEMIEDNIASMSEIARANGIRVVLCSVLPVWDYPWKKGLEPAEKIVALNAWIRDYASRTGAAYADFHSAMSDERHGMKAELARDGVHPNAAGYAIMAPIVEKAIGAALGSRSDELDIGAARERSNRAIAAHDLDAAAAIWSADYVGVSSGNVRALSRDMEREHFGQLMATRPNVVYVRTPASIVVNAKWAQAGENGRWTGSWTDSTGTTRVGGVYFAKWRKENGAWRILAETFVQTSCSGTKYCDNPPATSR